MFAPKTALGLFLLVASLFTNSTTNPQQLTYLPYRRGWKGRDARRKSGTLCGGAGGPSLEGAVRGQEGLC